MGKIARSASFTLTAILNGNTYYSSLVLDSGSKSLVQFWDKSANKVTPSWENNGPKFHMYVCDNEGREYVPLTDSVKLYYNSQELSFGADGIDTSIKAFKRTVDTNSTPNKVSFQIIKDLFSDTNQDNDEIYIKGTIQIKGNNFQEVQTQSTAITLVQTASVGTQYYPVLECGAIMPNQDETACTLKLYSTATGLEVTENVTYKFYYANRSDDVEINGSTPNYSISGNVLTIKKEAVESTETIKGTCVYEGKEYSDWGIVVDYNDPIVVGTYINGTQGGSNIADGETAQVGVMLFKTDNDGVEQDVTSQYTFDPRWTVLKADGNTELLTESEKSKKIISISYDKVIEGGGSVSGFVSIENLQPIS